MVNINKSICYLVLPTVTFLAVKQISSSWRIATAAALTTVALAYAYKSASPKRQWLEKNFEIIQVSGDGNRAAHAILKLTKHIEINTPEKLRKAIADHVPITTRRPRKGQPHINAALHSLLSNQFKPSNVASEWVKLYREKVLKADYVLGTHDLLYVASLFKADIVVYSGKLEDGELPCENIDSYSDDAETIHLWNDGDRYWALRPKLPQDL